MIDVKNERQVEEQDKTKRAYTVVRDCNVENHGGIPSEGEKLLLLISLQTTK